MSNTTPSTAPHSNSSKDRTGEDANKASPNTLSASSASVLARETLMAFGAQFAKSELAGVKNPIPINNLIGRCLRGAIEALEKAFAERGL